MSDLDDLLADLADDSDNEPQEVEIESMQEDKDEEADATKQNGSSKAEPPEGVSEDQVATADEVSQIAPLLYSTEMQSVLRDI